MILIITPGPRPVPPVLSIVTSTRNRQVCLPPDDVYDIITDPNNRRVFKNVKEVTYRKVLEDDEFSMS
ncbi:hypothetical protein R1flu_001439 [Riccia fluitans]|uniref:Uncharacterized protein n=1 Tax=Riccia fluitans TaxID=41844 RepID=A0ABD1Y4A0_9MARC